MPGLVASYDIWTKNGTYIQPGTHSGSLISKSSLPEQVEEENQGGTGWPRYTWETAIKMEVVTVKNKMEQLLRLQSSTSTVSPS